VNSATLTGHLGQDPRLATLPSGDPVLNFSLAVKRRAKVGGQWEDQTLWVDCALFGKRAEGLSRFLAKGARVGVTGEIGLREYTARDGQKRATLELVARDVEVLESKREREARDVSGYSAPDNDNAPRSGGRPYGQAVGAGNTFDPDDPIPF
jgi:single-strand DNA-binding protein